MIKKTLSSVSWLLAATGLLTALAFVGGVVGAVFGVWAAAFGLFTLIGVIEELAPTFFKTEK